MPEKENKFKKILEDIVNSSGTESDQINAISNLMGNLNTLNENIEICMAADRGIHIARKSRPEMAAQFCLTRAKAEIAQAGMIIAEMRNLTTAINWFGFALETAENRYNFLNKKLNSIWITTQAYIDAGYELLNERPIIGAVAFCHNTAGQIYGTHYLQLKLHYFKAGRPWRSRFGNYNLIKWLDLDDFFVIEKKSRKHLRKVRGDCLRSIHSALKLFKQEEVHSYVADTYLGLCLEHHSFNSPIRSKYYFYVALQYMRSHDLQSDPRLKLRVEALRDMPSIGSYRTEKVSDILPEL